MSNFCKKLVPWDKAAETQTWIEFAVKCKYLDVETGRELYSSYNQVLGGLVNMIKNPSPWLIPHSKNTITNLNTKNSRL